ncbi:MAG: RdgB/HAM1 family non-canonical purine NTP pyrophosphatase [Deinococcales bacterium]
MKNPHRILCFVIATANEGKLKEFRHILARLSEIHDGVKVEVVSAAELGLLDFPPEDGDSYEANALIKARYVTGSSGLIAIADDSGLEVDALGGAPGIYSARYGGKGSDGERLNYLLEQMKLYPNAPRSARFQCAIVLNFPNGSYKSFFGTSEGSIITQAKGENGFGYDPIFLSDDLNLTFAEASQEQKKAVSHRGRAVASLISWLQGDEINFEAALM